MRNETTNKGLIEGPFLCIVNPNSGTGGYKRFQAYIDRVAPANVQVVASRSGAHSIELAQDAASNGVPCVVAVGGDGSVHEIGTTLIGSNTALGIIPTGSGNGIARHLGLSMDIPTATQQVLAGRWRYMDTLRVNQRPVIGFAGVGFDGYVAERFSKSRTRGFSNYVKLTLDAVSKFTPGSCVVRLPDAQHEGAHLSVVAANISQFGNDAFINPTARDADGLVDILRIQPFPAISFPALAGRLFQKTFHRSRYVLLDHVPSVVIENRDRMPMHVDGEPAGNPEEIHVECVPKSLKVIVP